MAGIDFTGAYSFDENAKADDFEPIPAGEYKAQIIEADKQDISRNNNYGECLVLKWKIMVGDYEGRLVWQRLNLWGENMNNNEKVVSIANSQFAGVREATGKLTPRDTDELLYIPCLIKVAIKQDKDKQYEPRNEIVSVKALAKTTAAGDEGDSSGAAPQPADTTPWPSNGGGGAAAARELDDGVPF